MFARVRATYIDTVKKLAPAGAWQQAHVRVIRGEHSEVLAASTCAACLPSSAFPANQHVLFACCHATASATCCCCCCIKLAGWGLTNHALLRCEETAHKRRRCHQALAGT